MAVKGAMGHAADYDLQEQCRLRKVMAKATHKMMLAIVSMRRAREKELGIQQGGADDEADRGSNMDAGDLAGLINAEVDSVTAETAQPTTSEWGTAAMVGGTMTMSEWESIAMAGTTTDDAAAGNAAAATGNAGGANAAGNAAGDINAAMRAASGIWTHVCDVLSPPVGTEPG